MDADRMIANIRFLRQMRAMPRIETSIRMTVTAGFGFSICVKVTVIVSKPLSPQVGANVVLLKARGTAITKRGITSRNERRIPEKKALILFTVLSREHISLAAPSRASAPISKAL